MIREIKIIVTAPVECTEEQFKEWAEYCTGYSSSISLNNPLCDQKMEADDIEVN